MTDLEKTMDNSIWRRPQDEPEDRQACNIATCDGMLCSVIVCNIPYFRGAKAWIDLFATTEAGDTYPSDMVSAWMPADLIPPVPPEFLATAEAAQVQKERAAAAPESARKPWWKKFWHR